MVLSFYAYLTPKVIAAELTNQQKALTFLGSVANLDVAKYATQATERQSDHYRNVVPQERILFELNSDGSNIRVDCAFVNGKLRMINVLENDGAPKNINAQGSMTEMATVDGVYGGTTKPLNVIMDRPHTVVANYNTISYILLQSSSPQGTGYTSVAPGYYTTGQHIQAYAYSGWEFDHWQINSDPPNYDNPIDITCSGWKTVTPVFVEVQPTCDLTVNAYLYDIPGSINVYIDYNWVGYTEYNAYVPTGNHYICTYDTEIYIPALGMYAYLAGIQVNGGDVYSPPGIEISLPQDPTTITFYYQLDWGLMSSPKQQAMLSQALQKIDWSATAAQSSR